MREQAGQDWLNELAAAVADGRVLDWDSLESSARDDDERLSIRRLRAIAAIGHAHADLTFTDTGSESLSVRSLLHGIEDCSTPATWGSLRILERVGRGRFGDVYRAWDPSLDREVALKLLRRRETESADREVIEEGRLMARVRHPNVVTIHGAQRIDGRTGLWMEFVEGRTLEAELRDRGPIPATEVIEVGIQLCRALAAVHDAGLVHRDVKAQNVLRDSQGRVVLGDFGTGSDIEDAGIGDANLAGTPAYLAPEIFDGGTASVQSDVYSLGVLLFRLTTGAYPVSGRTLREIQFAHQQKSRVALGTLRPDLPQALAAAIEHAIDPDASSRFESAAAFEAALEVNREQPATVSVATSYKLLTALAMAAVAIVAVFALRQPNVRPAVAAPPPVSTQSQSLVAAPQARNEVEEPSSVATPVPTQSARLQPATSQQSDDGPDRRGADTTLWSFADAQQYAQAAEEHLRKGELSAARRYAAMMPSPPNDDERGVWDTWRLSFDARLSWADLKAADALTALDALTARMTGDADIGQGVLPLMYVALGRLKQAERRADSIPRHTNDGPPNASSRDWILATVLRHAADPTALRDHLLAAPPSAIIENAKQEFLIRAGLIERAESTNRMLRQFSRSPGRYSLDIQAAEAELTLLRGEPARAIELLEAAQPIPGGLTPTNAQMARVRALAWEALGDIDRAIAALNGADVQRFAVAGSNTAGLWLEQRALLARMHRKAGQNADARTIETELRKLLAVADDDHPIVRQLRAAD